MITKDYACVKIEQRLPLLFSRLKWWWQSKKQFFCWMLTMSFYFKIHLNWRVLVTSLLVQIHQTSILDVGIKKLFVINSFNPLYNIIKIIWTFMIRSSVLGIMSNNENIRTNQYNLAALSRLAITIVNGNINLNKRYDEVNIVWAKLGYVTTKLIKQPTTFIDYTNRFVPR